MGNIRTVWILCSPLNTTKKITILNRIYIILAELEAQEKKITLGKVPAHIGIKGNKEADKAVNKQSICQEWLQDLFI